MTIHLRIATPIIDKEPPFIAVKVNPAKSAAENMEEILGALQSK